MTMPSLTFINVIQWNIVFISIGWTLLMTTSASLLLPHPNAVYDRFRFVLKGSQSQRHFGHGIALPKLRVQVLMSLLANLLYVYPLSAYLWCIDDVLYGKELSKVKIVQPLVAITAPRSGSTSFHRMLTLDDRYASPSLIELAIPFLFVHKIVDWFNVSFPNIAQQFSDWITVVVSKAPSAKFHELALQEPEADEVFVAEWHWVHIQAVRQFPVSAYWYKNYKYHDAWHRHRTRRALDAVYKKVLYRHRYYEPSTVDGSKTMKQKRLLVRSHRSSWVHDFHVMYPDAIYVGSIRDPASMVRSLASFFSGLIEVQTGVDMFGDIRDNNHHQVQISNKKNLEMKGKNANGMIEDNKQEVNGTKANGAHKIVHDKEHNKQQHLGSCRVDLDLLTFSGAVVGIMSDLFGSEADLFSGGDNDGADQDNNSSKNADEDNGIKNNIENNDNSSEDPRKRAHYITFPLFKADPILAVRRLYQDMGIDITDRFRDAMNNSIREHDTYKQRYKYQNLTLDEMLIEANDFHKIPAVKKYVKLLERDADLLRTLASNGTRDQS